MVEVGVRGPPLLVTGEGKLVYGLPGVLSENNIILWIRYILEILCQQDYNKGGGGVMT